MSKFFKNLCAEFDEYNPEDNLSHLKDGETFDEDGLLHSFDDLPSRVLSNADEEGDRTFYWHSHGERFRENDKPACVIYEDSAYSTINTDSLYHSFEGKPSRIAYDTNGEVAFVSFYKDDGLHRENGLPAQLIFDRTGCLETKFYENNKLHRDNDLPASFEGLDGKNEWAINGYRHRENGPAISYPVGSPNIDKWILFDVRLSEPQFTSIKNFQREKNVPLWLAFLRELNLIEEANLNLFLENNLHNELPLEWKLKSLGVTEDSFRDAVIELRKTQVKVYEAVKTLKAVVDIVRFNEQKLEANA